MRASALPTTGSIAPLVLAVILLVVTLPTNTKTAFAQDTTGLAAKLAGSSSRPS